METTKHVKLNPVKLPTALGMLCCVVWYCVLLYVMLQLKGTVSRQRNILGHLPRNDIVDEKIGAISECYTSPL